MKKPKIISAVDLSHVNRNHQTQQGLSQRRRFLKQLLQAGVIIGMPGILLSSCEDPDNNDITCSCENEGSCTCENESSCTCQSENSCSCESDFSNYEEIQVLTTDPADGATGIIPYSIGIPITLFLTGAPRYTSFSEVLRALFKVEPAPQELSNFKLWGAPDNAPEGATHSIEFYIVGANENTEYTVTMLGVGGMDGSWEDPGNPIGNPFEFSFTTGELSSCTCQSDGPGCSTDSCICVSFTCSCQFAGCPTYRL